MIGGATCEPAAHGYAVAQLLYAGEYCANLVARGMIGVSSDAAFGATRDASAALAVPLGALDTDGWQLLELLLKSMNSFNDVSASRATPRPRTLRR